MASNVRQERRKKIMERGSDRLALITGQIQNLSESPSSTPTYRHHHGHTESSPTIIFSPEDHTKINAGFEHLDGASAAKLLKLKTISAVPESKYYDIPRRPESRLGKCETNPENISFQVPDTTTGEIIQESANKEIQECEVVPTRSRTSSIHNAPNRNYNYRLFTPNRINSCIIASERTRAICSFLVAFLVVNRVGSESFIVSRPLFIVLFTDVTIVLALLFRESEYGSDEDEKGYNLEDEDNWDLAVRLLERGLVVYQAIRGIFIDCSIYLAVVICCLSLV